MSTFVACDGGHGRTPRNDKHMKPSAFFSKFKSLYLWGNLLAMAVVVVAIVVGIKIGLDVYTHHGEEVVVPDIENKALGDARHLLGSVGLGIAVSDTGHVKRLPEDCVLKQSIEAGSKVKAGRVVSVTINSHNAQMLTIPDIIDNCSWREAKIKLTAMGFKVGNPRYIPGEGDWVYGITVRGRDVTTGQKVSADDVLTVQVGDGTSHDDESEVTTYDEDYDVGGMMTADDAGDFEAVTGEDDAY